MRNYVISDIHGFYREMRYALLKAGYDDDQYARLVVLGDCWDRGPDPYGVYCFLHDEVRWGKAVLIRGNHEYLMLNRLTRGHAAWVDLYNGTEETLKALSMESPMTEKELSSWVNGDFWKDYVEIGDYIFVHGWVPLGGFDVYRHDDIASYQSFSILPDWRGCKDRSVWENASWESGVKALAAGLTIPKKTIVCGHRSVSAFHEQFDDHAHHVCGADGSEDSSIFRGGGCIAVDACTVRSHKVNVLVLETPD